MSDDTVSVDIRDLLVAKIREIAPKLTEGDVEDLLDMAARGKTKQLKQVLTNYKLAKTLNVPTTKNIFDFLNGLNPFFKFAKALGSFLGL